ncbi:MAG: lipoyl synthase [Dehalococcoidia bacterium]|jgi:lipoic acid synthetase|uniref:lipoyl synthase n=1 Tax=Candidatus Amarobacter glycogenicus TaxID=3140699 RepID=UPI0031352EBE|nr:lipoyl synthase [Dehalococcoidia bacterium]
MALRHPERPPWLKVRFPAGGNYERIRVLMREQELNTVCEEARCPNIGDCWSRGTATFMILGDTCTRSCGFCAVKTGRPGTLDREEPRRVALAIQRLGLRHAVITSVNRDELADGGAGIFAETIEWSRRLSPDTTFEVLIPDFKGDWAALRTVLGARPEILNHNTETVPRLYSVVRPQARYERSLELLRTARELDPGTLTKSGLMVGLGETSAELLTVFRDLRDSAVDILTVGQYLQPTPGHLPVARYWTPEEFEELKTAAIGMGFKHVECGPLVRSSYHAEEQVAGAHPGLSPRADEPRIMPLAGGHGRSPGIP